MSSDGEDDAALEAAQRATRAAKEKQAEVARRTAGLNAQAADLGVRATQLSAAAQMAMEAVKALRAKNAAPAQRSSSYGGGPSGSGGFCEAAEEKPPP